MFTVKIINQIFFKVTTYSTVQPALCLEANKNIKITLLFNTQGAGQGREASILIDSVSLNFDFGFDL